MSVDVRSYLEGKNLRIKQATGGNVHLACPFCLEDESKRGRLYVQTEGEKAGLFHCFAAGTMVVTAEGTREISSLVGESPTLLASGHNPTWVESPVSDFGEQEIWELVLSRNGVEQTIRTTAEHRWFVNNRKGEVLTKDLKVGHALQSHSAYPYKRYEDSYLNHHGVVRGFIYGDGTTAYRGSAVNVNECKWDVLPYFSNVGEVTSTTQFIDDVEFVNLYRLANGFPRSYKTEFPDLSESRSYLYGWLAGYFASDGCVSDEGNCTLSSAHVEDLEYVRDLCHVLGIRPQHIKTQIRRGLGTKETPLYQINLCGRDLDEQFFIRESHRKRWIEGWADPSKYVRMRWRVKSVRATGTTETVYCATVPEYGNFTLDGNILTGNCFRCDESGGINKLRGAFGDPPLNDDELDESWIAGRERQKALDLAANFYAQKLFENSKVLDYLKNERGLTEQSIRDARLGWADGGLAKQMMAEGVSGESLKSVGLLYPDGRDFFYGYITIPYFAGGHVSLIRGRIFGTDKGAKYKTPLGQSPQLFNSDLTYRTEGEITITESEFDCYSGDTEVLLESGWCSLEQYDGKSPVAQWDDGAISFVDPLAFKSKWSDSTLLIQSVKNGGVDLLVTPSHRMISLGPSGYYVHTAKEGPERKSDHIPTAGVIDGPGLNLSDAEIRLLIAIQADASIDERKLNGAQYCRFGFHKSRKIEALRGLLEELGIENSDSELKSSTRSICFRVPNYLHAFKEFPWEWIKQASLAQRQLILQELSLWDGNETHRANLFHYVSSIKANVEWVQALAHTSGSGCTVSQKMSNDHGSWWRAAYKLDRTARSWQGLNAVLQPGMTVYALQVPSTFLLVRRNGNVSVSGNCLVLNQLGIDAVATPGVTAWEEKWVDYFAEYRRIYVMLDPDTSGKAAAEKIADHLSPRARIVELPPPDATGRKFDPTELYVREGWDRDKFDSVLSAAKGGVLKTAQDAYNEWLHMQSAVGLKFGFEALDAVLDPGLLGGQLFIIGASTGAGKTIYVINLMHRVTALNPDMKVLFISLEQTEHEWFERARRIYRFYNPTKSDYDALNYWRDRMWLVDENVLSVSKMKEVIEQFALDVGQLPDLVVVDYLGYWARAFKGEAYERISAAVMSLKAIAKEFRIPFIVPHQLSRSSAPGEEPKMSSLRDGGPVEETADFVGLLWSADMRHGRSSDDITGERLMRLSKSRHGGVGHLFRFRLAPLSLVMVGENETDVGLVKDEISYSLMGDTFEDAIWRHRTGVIGDLSKYRDGEGQLLPAEQLLKEDDF